MCMCICVSSSTCEASPEPHAQCEQGLEVGRAGWPAQLSPAAGWSTLPSSPEGQSLLPHCSPGGVKVVMRWEKYIIIKQKIKIWKWWETMVKCWGTTQTAILFTKLIKALPKSLNTITDKNSKLNNFPHCSSSANTTNNIYNASGKCCETIKTWRRILSRTIPCTPPSHLQSKHVHDGKENLPCISGGVPGHQAHTGRQQSATGMWWHYDRGQELEGCCGAILSLPHLLHRALPKLHRPGEVWHFTQQLYHLVGMFVLMYFSHLEWSTPHHKR